jgi:type II secretory pathway component PulF
MSLKSKFAKQRADYYADLSMRLQTPGVKLSQIFEKDAARYPDAPQGKLAAIWAERLQNNGAVLADAWEGDIPEDDLASVRVLEMLGNEALISGLSDLSRVARLQDSIRQALTSTLAMAIIMLGLAAAAAAFIPAAAVNTFKEALNVPTSAWGPAGQSLANWASFFSNWGVPTALLTLGLGAGLAWSINHWTGELRNRLDQWCPPFKTVRDVRSMSFVAALAILCKPRGLSMLTMGRSIELLFEATSNPYMRWRLGQLVERIHETGAVGSDKVELSSTMLDTGFMSTEALNRFIDTEEYSNFATAAGVTSAYIEARLLPQLIKRLNTFRWTLMLASVGVILFLSGQVYLTGFEMKGVLMNNSF